MLDNKDKELIHIRVDKALYDQIRDTADREGLFYQYLVEKLLSNGFKQYKEREVRLNDKTIT